MSISNLNVSAKSRLSFTALRKIDPSCTAPDEDRHRVLVADGEQAGLLHPERLLHLRDVAAEQGVELRRGHLALEVRPLHQRGEEPVGVEQRLLPEAEVVDADHAREPKLEVAGVRVHLADGVADDAVGVVVEVRARRREAAQDAALDERDDAALVQPRRRHRARQREEDAAVLLDRAAHQLVRGALLPADVRAERVLEQVVGRFLAGDRARIDGAGLLEGSAQLGLGRHGAGEYRR